MFREISFTKVSEIFDEELIEELKDYVQVEAKACHQNAALVAKWLTDYGFECYFNTGFIGFKKPGFEHSFNRVVIDGNSYFIDLTAELTWDGDTIPVYYDNHEYDIDYIMEAFEEENYSFSPLDPYYSNKLRFRKMYKR